MAVLFSLATNLEVVNSLTPKLRETFDVIRNHGPIGVADLMYIFDVGSGTITSRISKIRESGVSIRILKQPKTRKYLYFLQHNAIAPGVDVRPHTLVSAPADGGVPTKLLKELVSLKKKSHK
jgi:hypothetical protein